MSRITFFLPQWLVDIIIICISSNISNVREDIAKSSMGCFCTLSLALLVPNLCYRWTKGWLNDCIVSIEQFTSGARGDEFMMRESASSHVPLTHD